MMMAVTQFMSNDPTDHASDQCAADSIAAAVVVGPHTHLLIPAGLTFDPNPFALHDRIDVHHLGIIVLCVMA
jgi:hypothetical protein